MYLEPEPSHVPISFQYDFDFLDFSGQAEDAFSLTTDPCQSESYSRYESPYDPSYHFLPLSSSTERLTTGMEHSVEQYQPWLQVDPNTHFIPQPYVSNASASSTFPGNSGSHNEIYAEIAGSSHLSMTSANDSTGTTLSFATYDDNNYM